MNLDESILHFINIGLSNPIFDTVLPYCREKLFWIPLYSFVLFFVFLNVSKKTAWKLLLAVGLTIALSDFTSSQLIKKNVQRLRPCNDPEITSWVQLRLEHCGSGYSFTSSHATNHFALAVVFSLFFAQYRPRWKGIFYAWAALVSFSQIYVGVHYPTDVLVGGLVGFFIGFLVFKLIFRLFPAFS